MVSSKQKQKVNSFMPLKLKRQVTNTTTIINITFYFCIKT